MDLLRWLRLQSDRVGGIAAVCLGALALVLGWLGVSREVFPAQQLAYLVSGGFGGLFLVGLGATLWLSGDMRDEWRKLDRIETRFARIEEELQRQGRTLPNSLPVGAGEVSLAKPENHQARRIPS